MKTKQLILVLLVCIPASLNAQSNGFLNADFELNNFDNWIGKTGGCCPVGMNSTGIVDSRQTIMSGMGIDPYSLGLIPFVPPGAGKYTEAVSKGQLLLFSKGC